MSFKGKVFNKSYFVIVAIFLGIILNIFLFKHIKNTVLSSFVGIEFYLENAPSPNTSLFYAFDDGFNAYNRIEAIVGDNNSLKFIFPKIDRIPTNFRLDFGEDPEASPIKIDSLLLRFNNDTIVLDENETFKTIFINSRSVNLDKDQGRVVLLKTIKPYDPYIVFNPLLEILLKQNSLRLLCLLFPFVLFLITSIKQVFKPTLLEGLLAIFIVCIPLKIAWTTFAALLLCLYSIIVSIRKKEFDFKNQHALLLIGIFFVLVVFGRVMQLKVIDHQIALIVFYVVIVANNFNSLNISKFYVYFFIFLNGLLVVAGLSYLFAFTDIYGLNYLDYFKEIKTYSGNMRSWLYYDHAVFLSLFGIFGLLFLNNLKNKVEIKKEWFYLYHLLLFLTITLVGARISFVIYIVFIANFLINLRTKWRIINNLFIFSIISILLISSIKHLDSARFNLWSVSWEAVKEKPFFGYGLGNSDKVLHQAKFQKNINNALPKMLNHSHNQFLTYLLEIGFLGCLFLAGVLVLYLRLTHGYKNITMLLFIFGLLYVFLTESILQTSKPFFVLCFIFMMIIKQSTIIEPNHFEIKE